jgi:hypothetical protein
VAVVRLGLSSRPPERQSSDATPFFLICFITGCRRPQRACSMKQQQQHQPQHLDDQQHSCARIRIVHSLRLARQGWVGGAAGRCPASTGLWSPPSLPVCRVRGIPAPPFQMLYAAAAVPCAAAAAPAIPQLLSLFASRRLPLFSGRRPASLPAPPPDPRAPSDAPAMRDASAAHG